MGYEHLETFFRTGRTECAMYGFEKALMFHFPTSAFTGLFVTVDRENGLDIDRLIEVGSAAIERES